MDFCWLGLVIFMTDVPALALDEALDRARNSPQRTTGNPDPETDHLGVDPHRASLAVCPLCDGDISSERLAVHLPTCPRRDAV